MTAFVANRAIQSIIYRKIRECTMLLWRHVSIEYMIIECANQKGNSSVLASCSCHKVQVVRLCICMGLQHLAAGHASARGSI